MEKRLQIQNIYDKFSNHFYSDEFYLVRLALEKISNSNEKYFPHELGKYIIFYSIPTFDPDLVIIANNPSWFDRYDNKLAKQNLEDVAGKLPTVNSYKDHNHKFGNEIVKVFEAIGRKNWIDEVVGLNRFWIQTGGKGTEELKKTIKELEIENMPLKPPMLFKKIENICHEYTKDLIRILNPKILILLGKPAQNVFPILQYPRLDKNNNTFIIEADHPSNRRKDMRGWKKTAEDIKNILEKFPEISG